MTNKQIIDKLERKVFANVSREENKTLTFDNVITINDNKYIYHQNQIQTYNHNNNQEYIQHCCKQKTYINKNSEIDFNSIEEFEENLKLIEAFIQQCQIEWKIQHDSILEKENRILKNLIDMYLKPSDLMEEKE